jgi:hypothetical protein
MNHRASSATLFPALCRHARRARHAVRSGFAHRVNRVEATNAATATHSSQPRTVNGRIWSLIGSDQIELGLPDIDVHPAAFGRYSRRCRHQSAGAAQTLLEVAVAHPETLRELQK